MRSLRSLNPNNKNSNPFIGLTKSITDRDFKYMIEEGFESSVLDCYAELKGEICYKNYLNNSCSVYITENGIALDVDYECGGNLRNFTWLFEQNSFEYCYNAMVLAYKNYM